MMGGCWNKNNESACDDADGCSWEAQTGAGWCEEVGCWNWDSMNGGSNESCLGNSSYYGLNCAWDESGAEGWCYPNFDKQCSNFTTERGCMDTFYCWWQYVDWENPASGGSCQDPLDMTWVNGDDSFFEEWNPGCYIFDRNETKCNNVIGCNYSEDGCEPVDVPGYVSQEYIEDNGINCSLINVSGLCNDIPMLSSCCEWRSGACNENRMTTSCWDDMEDLNVGGIEIVACEDVSMATSDADSAQTLCEDIAGEPWYLPCEWDDSSKTCRLKVDDIFGDRGASFSLIDNKKTCEAAGGFWISENYCEGNVSVPAGRCEQKADDERNCNKACFACEYEFDGSAHDSAQAAKEYCYNSNLGFCEFIADEDAPNGFGFCKAKDQFKKGVAGDCKNDCGSCTFLGNPYADSYADKTPATFDSCNTPECFCELARNFDNVNCKWVEDSNSPEGGFCIGSSEKVCEDACDRCYSRTTCLEDGRSSFGAEGSCEWIDPATGSVTTSNTDGICQKTGETEEVCWDAKDNDNDGLVDCADSGCFGDSSCGFVEGDCFGWLTQESCENVQLSNGLNCTWASDPWGSWCDFPGATCWQEDGNETACTQRADCDWSSGSGSGFCNQDWDAGQDCYGAENESQCTGDGNPNNCTWTTDMWCEDNPDDPWCADKGGWCDPAAFAPKGCWLYDDNESACNLTNGCFWVVEGDEGFCEEMGCWNYDSDQDECDEQEDCVWKENDWGESCEVDWGTVDNCWVYDGDEESCNNHNNTCMWFDEEDGLCENKFEMCWEAHSEDACEDYSDTCSWNQWGCEPICFNLDSDSCTDVGGCTLRSGWCESSEMASMGGVECWQYDDNQSGCNGVSGCKWQEPGWCNPKGFMGGDAEAGKGGGANKGVECWKYDGNEDFCTNSSIINITCAWMDEFRPFCEPNWGKAECWNYGEGDCESNGCYWDDVGGFCSNIFDQCFMNQSLQFNESLCNANLNCNWSNMGPGGGHCEPSCFVIQDEGSCTGDCRWIDGWCNPPGKNDQFVGMESGAPVMISFDDCDDESEKPFVDLCGVGMKGMDETFGFGGGVADFSEAGVCYQEKIGFGNMFGSGNETIKFYIYLDTDGSTEGSCSLSHNTSEEGYEFFLKYIAEWNSDSSNVDETFTAYKCGSNGWTVADIGLGAWKEKMCGELGGPMIAVEKADLKKFSSLYDSEADMRVFAAMADENGSASNPSDTSGPGWVTPGAIDFDLANFFEYGADSAKFEDIMKKGFVEYEDCFNSVDDDKDGLTDCYDWDCEFMPHCNTTTRAEDTSMPMISGIRVEEYPDGALVMYNTNKPTNGTVTFWHNDSSCSSTSLNRTIYDPGIYVETMREKKLWHAAHIYNDGGAHSLDYNLSNDKVYYYKIKICDSGGRCSQSSCTSLRTAEDISDCGYCNFVTRIKVPGTWNVYYDFDTDGDYEHWQGHECGPKAGVKTNYTVGRKVNIKLNNSAAEVYFEFMNTTITKTGLTNKIRDISGNNGLIYDSQEDYVGMPSQSRDKIINNLHPESCRVKIPSSGDCDKLYHCDDNGDNCEDRTSEATLIDAEECLWELPYCEFSTWDEDGNLGDSGDDDSSGGGSSSGGGGVINTNTTYVLEDYQFKQGVSRTFEAGDRFKIAIQGLIYYVSLIRLENNSAIVEVASTAKQRATMVAGESKRFDVTGNGVYDLSVILISVNETHAGIFVRESSGDVEIPVVAVADETQQSPQIVPESSEGQEAGRKEPITGDAIDEIVSPNKLSPWLWVVIGIVVLMFLVVVSVVIKKNYSRK
jgi:hypothetical protein